jgi:ankyrin repeat protein
LGVAAQLGYTEVAELLLQRHPDLDARDDDGDTPLGMAISFHHVELARRLEAAGARDRGRPREVSGK